MLAEDVTNSAEVIHPCIISISTVYHNALILYQQNIDFASLTIISQGYMLSVTRLCALHASINVRVSA